MYTMGAGLASPAEPIENDEAPDADDLRQIVEPGTTGAQTVQFGSGYGPCYDTPTNPGDVRIVVRAPPRKGRW